jgi:hypothetical protein
MGAPDPGFGGAPPPADQHQFGAGQGANPLGATFAIGQDSPMAGGAPPPAAGQPFGAPPGGDFGGAPAGGGGYGAPPGGDPNMGGYGGAPMGGPPPGADGGFGAPQQQYGAPPGGAPQQGYPQPGGGYGGDPMQQMNQGMNQGMNPYGGGGPMMGPMGGNPMAAMGGPGKAWMTTLLLAIAPSVFGVCGVHRFYTGHTVIGILQFLTVGGCGIWQLIDIIFILTGKYTDAQGRPLQR